MPRFAFAMPFLPEQEARWRATAARIPTRHATEHRRYLRSRGIFRERWWIQTGEGSPPLTLALWDCDDVASIFSARPEAEDAHERWIAEEIIHKIHGIDPGDYRLPRPELLSGTTTMATATAETQTTFALPIPPEGVPAVRSLLERVEHGDLARVHGQFLVDSSIREEWIWLQPAGPQAPPLLLVHWIGDDLHDAWQRLTFVGADDYARVLHQALFTRVVGIAPQQVAQWRIEQLLVMHVRRSDSFDLPHRVLGHRVATAIAGRQANHLERLLDDEVAMTDATVDRAAEARTNGRADVIARLLALHDRAGGLTVADVLVGERSVMVLLEDADGRRLPLLLGIRRSTVSAIELLQAAGT